MQIIATRSLDLLVTLGIKLSSCCQELPITSTYEQMKFEWKLFMKDKKLWREILTISSLLSWLITWLLFSNKNSLNLKNYTQEHALG